MWKQYKNQWKENFKKDAGGRSGIRALLYYVRCLLVIDGIHFAFFFAIIFAASLIVFFHVLPAQDVGEVAGITLLCWLCFSLVYGLTRSGSEFVARLENSIEKSILQGFHALRILPILPLSQDVKFIRLDEAAGSFFSSTPFIPPRLRLA